MNENLPTLAAGALVLALTAGVYADDKPTVDSIKQPTSPPAQASAGLVNDWLREESSFFDPWDLGGQFRTRFEHKEHFAIGGTPGSFDFRESGADTDNTYLLFREKVHLGYTPCPWFTAFVEGRDSFEQHDDRNPDPESDRFDLNQAWLRFGNATEFPLTAKVGRQELAYGDERLIGTSDWNNLGRVFDAAKLRYENEDLWMDVFSSRVVLVDDNNFNVSNDYDYLSGIYASTRTLVPKQETQFYFLSRNTSADSPNATSGSPQAGGPAARDIYTAGLRVKSLPGGYGGWDYSAEVAGQFGRIKETAGPQAGVNLDHEALAVTASGGYTWTKAFGSPRVGLEYNYASGDRNPNDGKHETFENLFPTNHKFYGLMDFFSWQNIHNLHLTSSFKPCKKLTLTASYDFFWLADTHDNFYTSAGARRGGVTPTPGTGYGINPTYSNYVGSELDLIGTYAIKPYASAQVGYGHFFIGDYVKSSLSAIGSSDADFVYVQVLFAF
ncbi:MAG: alginate export family protein [Verrucomicrobia bacterium]|nr:alginate export family protein [Verrucomicrobiota bacterium]